MDGGADHLAAEPVEAQFAQRLAAARDAALGARMVEIVSHLHAFLRATRPSRDELVAALGFLTEVGQACHGNRQEWVLLADALGVSALIEDQSATSAPGATPATLRGPFYRPGAPLMAQGDSISRDGVGQPLAVTLTLSDLQGRPVAGALVECWQANGDGLYENQQPDLQPDFNLRGAFRSDAAGCVAYRTVRPGGYDLPQDGPVGQLLGGLGYRLRRPAHLHLHVIARGFRPLTTHLYDGSDPAIAEDALFSVRPGLIADLKPAPGGWRLDHSIILTPDNPALTATQERA